MKYEYGGQKMNNKQYHKTLKQSLIDQVQRDQSIYQLEIDIIKGRFRVFHNCESLMSYETDKNLSFFLNNDFYTATNFGDDPCLIKYNQSAKQIDFNEFKQAFDQLLIENQC